LGACSTSRSAKLTFTGIDYRNRRAKRSEVAAAVTGQAVSAEELDIWLASLTESETETFMMLLAKAQGRWVEPPAIEQGLVETTATSVEQNGSGS
jgi:hypothetical protein